MLVLSLVVNVLALVPLLIVLWLDRPRLARVYGADSPARRILACVYGAIMAASMGLLVGLWAGAVDVVPMAKSLLVLQVIYKLATAPVVGLGNPVVIANLAIAALHGVTLVTIS
jgi:hypothetical protein